MRNVLTKAAVDIPRDVVDIEQLILSAFNGIDKIYSYIVYAKYNGDILDHWKVEFMLSQHDDYNQLTIPKVAKRVANLTELSMVNETRKILGYEQPSIDVLLTAYDPLVNSLAREEHNRWQTIDYEDLLQMCRLVIMRLYRNGYYIHKRLLRRAFSNEVLMYLRKDKNKPITVSLEDNAYSDDGDDISLTETIADQSLILEEQDMLDKTMNDDILKAKRDLIVKKIGQRQYDQLLREYGNQMTTSWSQKLVFTLKNSSEVSKVKFDKYY